MGVKELVSLYEQPTIPRRQSTVGRPSQHQPSSSSSSPTLARSIFNDPSTPTLYDSNDPDDTHDITEGVHTSRRFTNPFSDSSLSSVTIHETLPLKPVLPLDKTNDDEHTLVASSLARDPKHASLSHHPHHLHKHYRFYNHRPIPATVVFARKAAPLHLPKLDNYLESLPPPLFTTYGAAEKSRPGSGMFPPMDRLAHLGRSIDDLETNASVPPFWRDRSSIFGGLVSAAMSITGSSAVATFYSLQGLANTVQIFALILNTIFSGDKVWSKWEQVIFGTIPNIIALNFASTLMQNLIFLLIFMTLAGILLFLFYRSTLPSFDHAPSTAASERYNSVEGLIQPQPISKGRQWTLVIVSFLLTSIYLPLSTMAMHILVWSDDVWVVPNPYVNETVVAAPLGPTNEWRDPLNFCWTTTMKRNEINWAPAFVMVALVVFTFLTIWYPWMLRRVIQRSVPKIDPYTDLGRKRTPSDMDNEYRRLLNRDRNPFAFLYNGFRRNHGTYISTYLVAKFSALFIVSVISPTNCLFRTLPPNSILIARQVLLLTTMIVWFGVQCWVAPFLDPVGNAGEWTSRLNYILTAAAALGIVLDGEDGPIGKALGTYVLYVIYIVTYGLTFYFTVIHLGFMRRLVKRLAGRIDFSIDIFSPRLDISPSSIHVKRRIWQESITTLLLTNPECAIPASQRMAFAQARDSEYPPYLMHFEGYPGERHVENLKILREVGITRYSKAVALISGPDFAIHKTLQHAIQKHYVGPDCYWCDPRQDYIPGCTKYFGNAWWIPFPPTLVIRYDDGPLAVLTEASRLKEYIEQNSDDRICRRREIRMALRALDGHKVRWPYEHFEPIGSQSLWCCGRHYQARTSSKFEYATLQITHRGYCPWSGHQFGSGFDIKLRYGRNLVVDSNVIGLNEDYELTPPLAHFLALNRHIIAHRMPRLEAAMAGYREQQRKECSKKRDVLSYRFLMDVYDQPRDPKLIAESAIKFERDVRVRRLLVGSEDVFNIAHGRMEAVTNCEASTWWYIFWDDLWRRNHDTIAALQLHATDFNPHYPSSIAYSPLPRPALESFLIQRGLMSKIPKWRDFFHHGLLNKLYLRLNQAVFPRSASRAIKFHVGDEPKEMYMEDVDILTQGHPSTFLGTGGGTDHDADSIRPRPAYHWEGLLEDELVLGSRAHRNWFAKMGAWFGVTPLWRSGIPSQGVALDVRLEVVVGGSKRYVLLEEEEL